MKKPLPIKVEFHETHKGRLLLLTCAETGRPLGNPSDMSVEYSAEDNMWIATGVFMIPVEEPKQREETYALGGGQLTDGWEHFEEEDEEEHTGVYRQKFGYKLRK